MICMGLLAGLPDRLPPRGASRHVPPALLAERAARSAILEGHSPTDSALSVSWRLRAAPAPRSGTPRIRVQPCGVGLGGANPPPGVPRPKLTRRARLARSRPRHTSPRRCAAPGGPASSRAEAVLLHADSGPQRQLTVARGPTRIASQPQPESSWTGQAGASGERALGAAPSQSMAGAWTKSWRGPNAPGSTLADLAPA